MSVGKKEFFARNFQKTLESTYGDEWSAKFDHLTAGANEEELDKLWQVFISGFYSANHQQSERRELSLVAAA